eukprot:c7123_g1_i2.p1 GENE.c7123_g1_i2~~c7123_g1_i2.p1  ORF type:complete len:433 (+),score=61.86 c7123_g1_i2:112-1410(+)
MMNSTERVTEPGNIRHPSVPSLSLSFASDVHIPDDDVPESPSPRSESGGRRSSGRERFAPYPLAQSPRLHSPRSPNVSPQSTTTTVLPSPNPSSPAALNAHLSVQQPRSHRRSTSDPRAINREALAQMVTETESDEVAAMDSDSDAPSPPVEFIPPTEPLSATLNITPNTRPDGPRHRRTKSDSAYLKVFSSAEGYRLVIPPQALKSLKDVDPQDQSVTVFLSRDPALEIGDARGRAEANKSSTRPKYYKCSKCGQPKKGHVCEFGNEKARTNKSLSPREPQATSPHTVSPYLDQILPFVGQTTMLHSEQLQPALNQSSLMRDFESNRFNSPYIDTFPPQSMQLASLMPSHSMNTQPATIYDSMHHIGQQDLIPPHQASFEMNDINDHDFMQVSETQQPNPIPELSMPFKMDSLERMFYEDLDADVQDMSNL